MTTPTLNRGRATNVIQGNWWPDRATWPSGAVGDALGRTVDAYEQWVLAGSELRALFGNVERAASQDARARGVALAHQEEAPEPEEPKLQARLIDLERELPALEVAYSTLSNETLALIETDETWVESARAARDDAVTTYERCIEAARDARRAVAETSALCDWHERRQAGRLRNVAPRGEGDTFKALDADLAKLTRPAPEPVVTVVDWGDDE